MTLFSKRDIHFRATFNNICEYTGEQKLFQTLAIFDFELICVQEETLKDTNTATWKWKHVPISAFFFSNLVEEKIFLCYSDPCHLVASFIGALENLASQSKATMKNFFFDIDTGINSKLGSSSKEFTQHHNRRDQVSLNDCDNDRYASIQFLQIQKNQNFDLQEYL